MRVGIVCPYSLDVPGGVQHHVCGLAEALIGSGHEVSVLAPADDEADLPPYVVPAGGTVPVRYNGSVARLSFGPSSMGRVRRWLAEQRLDLLHVHEPTAPSLSMLAVRAAVEVPVVATFHSSMTGGSRAMAFAGPVLRPALDRIGARIAVSGPALRTMQRHVGGSGVVIPNGLWVESYAGVPGPGPGADGVTVAFLGRMDEPRKGLEVLLAAWPGVVRRRPDVRLVVAGHGDVDRARARIDGSLAPEVARTVNVVGTVAEKPKCRLLGAADLFVAPHTGGESFGIVLVEAMAAGTPVLASDLDAFADVLDGGRLGGLFPAGDVDALTAGIDALLGDPVRRSLLTARAAAAVQAYDWSVVAGQVLRVYDTVSTGRAPVCRTYDGRNP